MADHARLRTQTSGQGGDWLRLQRKIFSRWVKLKVAKREITVNDVVTDIADGLLLINLMEVLSEKTCTAKYIKTPPKMRPQKLDNASVALKFCFTDCGVEMKLPPSPDNLVDGDERSILGLIWAIMLKYIKIGDEDEGQQLNAKDALLVWVRNKTEGYGLKVEGFGKDFHDGLILCALIHKHRPKLINWDTLNREDRKTNLQLAIDAAEKYFGLERYLTPEDIPKLDENSMVVYVSEYYYGIAEQMKLDLAARRIAKVIALTQQNDQARHDYNEQSRRVKAHMKKVESILEDRSIDNTMNGARKRIEEFYGYKANDKNVIIGDQLNLEALYNNLAMRLSHNKRPEYVPPEGLSLRDIEKDIAHLEACEQERKVALHAELNRQIKLVKLDEQHKHRYEKLLSWIAQKEAYLKTKEQIDSVSAAQLQLKLLDAFDKERETIYSNSVQVLRQLGTTLANERYENHAAIVQREKEIEEAFVRLAQLSQQKRPILDDDLAREQFKEKVLLLNKQHSDNHSKIKFWIGEKEHYLKTKEEIHSVAEARTQLSLLESFEKDKTSMTETTVKQLRQLGANILSQKYTSEYSSWAFEHPEEIRERELSVDDKFTLLASLSAEKKKVLDDDLAREEYAARVRLMDRNHQAKFAELQSWIAEKENYLQFRESISSVAEAETQLSLLDGYERAKESLTTSTVAQLRQLGKEILAAKYSSGYSSYVFESPSDITTREAEIEKKWQVLSELSQEKKRVLEDHLAREEFKEKVRLMSRNHLDKFTRLQSWIHEKENYLNFREEINSVSEAQTQISLLETYVDQKQSLKDTSVQQLNQLGQEILAQKYSSSYSTWSIEDPAEITTRHKEVDDKWELLTQLSDEKRKVLKDHLAREEFKERVRLLNRNHIAKFDEISSWIIDKEEYLRTKEDVQSISEAKTHISLLETYEKEKEALANTNVARLKMLGQEILSAKYSSVYSSYTFENPSEITDRESHVDTKWELLTELSQEKRRILDDHLAREEFREKVRLMNRNHMAKYEELRSWITEKETYLNTKENISSISEAKTQLSLLDNYEKDKEFLATTNVIQLKNLGQEILSAKYTSSYSSYVFPTPEEVKERESEVDSKWILLSELSQEKRRVLDDDLAREQFKARVRLMNRNHIDKFDGLSSWIAEKESYLQFREEVNSVSEAQTQISLLETYIKEKAALAETNVVQLKKLGESILAEKYSTRYSSWTIENPEEITTRHSNIDKKWEVLTQLSDEKRRVLDDHLAREEFKEKVRRMNANHVAKYDELQSWVSEKQQYLTTAVPIDSISEAQTQLSLLQVYNNENSTVLQTTVAYLRNLGLEIVQAVYGPTSYSTYKFEHPEEVKKREDQVADQWKQLASLEQEKKKQLEADLANELEKERLRLEFAHLSGEFVRWIKDTVENVQVYQFGFTLEEVEQYSSELQRIDSSLTTEANTKTSAYQSVWQQLQSLKVTRNIYTSETPESLSSISRKQLDNAIQQRQKDYQLELSKQRENDNLCKKFASIADPFSKWISDQKDKITKSKEALEAQLEYVEERLKKSSEEGGNILANIEKVSQELDNAGITNNRHTTLTHKDVEVQWQQYLAFLQKKKTMLEEEIAHLKLRGITPQQFKEIEDNFNRFDADKSGSIDRKELKACLYSLGEEKTSTEINEIMAKFGRNGHIPYEGFKEFMIGVLGVSDTKDDIFQAFRLINKGAETATVERMELVMAQTDLDYVVQTAQKSGNGYDYVQWTEGVFAR